MIELMVALAVVAVLGVISYRGVAAASESRQRLAAEYRRWGDVTRFVRLAEADLLQIVARPGSHGGAGESLQTASGADGPVELSFLKLDGARASARRVGYRLDGTRLLLLRWPGTDHAAPPAEDLMLDRVKSLHFAFLSNGQWVATWPPSPAERLPVAIEMKLELADAGTIRRVIALR